MFHYKEKKYKVFESVDQANELLEGKAKAKLNGKWSKYFLINENNKYYLIRNLCPHQKKPIFEGKCIDNGWQCPWHQYTFDLKNGRGHGLYLEIHELSIDKNGLFMVKEVFSIF